MQKKLINVQKMDYPNYERRNCSTCGRPMRDISEKDCVTCRELVKKCLE